MSKLLWLFPEAVLGVPVLGRHRWRQDIGHEAFPEQGVAPRRDVCSVSDVPGLPGSSCDGAQAFPVPGVRALQTGLVGNPGYSVI